MECTPQFFWERREDHCSCIDVVKEVQPLAARKAAYMIKGSTSKDDADVEHGGTEKPVNKNREEMQRTGSVSLRAVRAPPSIPGRIKRLQNDSLPHSAGKVFVFEP